MPLAGPGLLVGADLGIMERDARAVRGNLPVLFTSLRDHPAAAPVVDWLRTQLPGTALLSL